MDKYEFLLNMVNEIRKDKGEDAVLSVKPEDSLRNDLGFDSMDLAVMTAKIEDQYDVDVFSDGIIDKVQDVYDKL